MIKDGDRVIYQRDGISFKGKVIKSEWCGITFFTRYKVLIDDQDLPYSVWCMTECLILDEPAFIPTNYGPKCTCGLNSTRHGGRHSEWCDLYNRFQD